MQKFSSEEIRTSVRDRYGAIAQGQGMECGCSSSCCTPPLGYSAEEMARAPEGANLGLGCGNPQAIADLKPGEVVLDLGSGGGFDCFLAANAVGEQGRVIGVDMTAQMISLSRRNVSRTVHRNVEFRLGEIEHLPVADASVDVIISNCVINLSPDKPQVFREAFRVLKSGGRLAVSDMVASGKIPDGLQDDLASYSACLAGASPVDELTVIMRDAGFTGIRIRPREESRSFNLENHVLSATIQGVKP